MSVNKAIILGRMGNDPEMRNLPSGEALANVSVATSESWKDKQTGEKREKTEWHRVTFFGKLAEVVGQYLKKGSMIYVEGQLETKKWTDKQNVERYTTTIKGRTMQMLDSKDSQQQAPQPHAPQQHAPQPQRQTQAPQNYQQAPPYQQQAPQVDSFDDDVPF